MGRTLRTLTSRRTGPRFIPRQWLRLAGVGVGSLVAAALLGACAPAAAPAPTSAPAPPAAPTAAPPAAAAKAPTAAPAAAAPKAPTPAPPAAAKAAAKKDLFKITFPTTFRINSADSPWYLAREKGYFAEQGLEVEIMEGTGSANTAKVVGSGAAPMGLVDGGVVIQSVAQGVPIKVVFGLTQISPISVIAPRSAGLSKPKDLEGKTIGGAQGGAGEVLFPGWLKKNGVDASKIQLVQVAAPARNALLIEKKVDATIGFIFGDLIIIRHNGVDAVPMRYADFGFNVPGTNMIVNTAFAKERPEIVRAFVAAAAKAYVESRTNPTAALESMVRQGPPHLKLEVEKDGFAELVKLDHSPRTQGKPAGWMAREDWEDAINLLAEHAALPTKPRVDDVITNEFVPGS